MQPEQPWNRAGAGVVHAAGTALEQSRRRVPEKADGAAGAVRKISKSKKYAAGNRRNSPGTKPAPGSGKS